MGDRGFFFKILKLKIKYERGIVYVFEFYRIIVFIVIFIICVYVYSLFLLLEYDVISF